MKQTVAVVTGVFALVAVFLTLGLIVGVSATHAESPFPTPTSASSPEPDRRDFMFQVAGYKTENQGGQTINLYFHYRYDEGIADADIPNYVDLRTEALAYLDKVDASKNPYWETLDKTICTRLKADFPIEAISCQMQVLPDDRSGLPYEPGYHGTIYTIGGIEPLAIPGPVPAS